MVAEDWCALRPDTADMWHQVLELLLTQQPQDMPPTAQESSDLAAADPLRWIKEQVSPRKDRSQWSPRRLPLDDGARSAWETFTRTLAEQTAAEDFPECLKGPWSKLRGYGARLALILEALSWASSARRGKPPTCIRAASVEGASKLVSWFQAQTRKVHAVLGTDVRRNDALRVLRWLAAHPEIELFTRRDAYQAMRRTFLRPSALDAPLALLVEHRYLSPVHVATAVRFEVNQLWNPRTL
jgi:hypothetical protein